MTEAQGSATTTRPDDDSGPKAKEEGKPEEAKKSDTAPANDPQKRPSGMEMLSTVLTRAAEHTASEHALASANIAFQVNNLAVAHGTALRKTNVGTDTLHRVRRTFVAPGGLADAWSVLADHHLLLLGGFPGDGREHLATFLLDAFCDARVRRLSHDSLAAVTDGDLTGGGGHLWTGAIGDDFDQRTAETLAGRLRRMDGRLIAIWREEGEWPPEFGDYVVEPARPNLDRVIERHLHPVAKPLLDQGAVEQLRQTLPGAHQAAQLAQSLNQVAAGRKSLKAALTRAASPERGIAEWFGDLPEREDQAFALALTALDNLSLPSVVTGARLADELIQRTADPHGRYGLRPFLRPTRTLLSSVDATVRPDVRNTGYGEVPITSVRLRRGFARELLDEVWRSFPYLQEIYMQWVDRLIRHQDPYIRERAAFAAGLIACHDFDFVQGRLLLGWADDKEEKVRRAAATALRPLTLDAGLREIVWTILDQWATEGDKPTPVDLHRRLTAAAALGGPVGGTDPARALDLITHRLLPHVTDAHDYDLWTTTAVAVSELFGDGGTPTSDRVLGRVLEWAESKESGPENVAAVVLLGLAGKPAGRLDIDDRQLPPLLRAAGRSPVNVERAAALWRHALGQPKYASPALTGLRRLAENAGTDGKEELTAVVAAIPQTVRERRTLSFEIRRWIRDEPHSPVFDHLRDTLSREENR